MRIERPHQLKRLRPVTRELNIKIAFVAENAFEQLSHQCRIVGDKKLDHEAFDTCADGAPTEFGQNIRLDPIEKLRRDRPAGSCGLCIQIGDAADQAHLLASRFPGPAGWLDPEFS